MVGSAVDVSIQCLRFVTGSGDVSCEALQLGLCQRLAPRLRVDAEEDVAAGGVEDVEVRGVDGHERHLEVAPVAGAGAVEQAPVEM